MLVSKSEQEKLLLSLLVNKVGDPESKIASKAVLLLNKLGNVYNLYYYSSGTIYNQQIKISSRFDGDEVPRINRH